MCLSSSLTQLLYCFILSTSTCVHCPKSKEYTFPLLVFRHSVKSRCVRHALLCAVFSLSVSFILTLSLSLISILAMSSSTSRSFYLLRLWFPGLAAISATMSTFSSLKLVSLRLSRSMVALTLSACLASINGKKVGSGSMVCVCLSTLGQCHFQTLYQCTWPSSPRKCVAYHRPCPC